MRIINRGEATEIVLYDLIGAEYGGDGVSAAEFHRELREVDDQQAVKVRINSPGGNFFDGITMHNLLKEHAGPVAVSVDGWAASAASIVAMAGDEITMADGSFIMIHNPWLTIQGDSDTMLFAHHRLREVTDRLVDLYSQRTSSSPENIREMMQAETWMNSEAAIANGFATRTNGETAIAACVDRNIFAYSVPDEAMAKPPAAPKRPLRREQLARLLKVV